MSNQTSSPSQTIDPYQRMQIILNPDGTLTRSLNDLRTLSSSEITLPTSVLTKDVTINQSNNTWLRLFLPRNAMSNNRKLPLIVFFHGGGFIILSAASTLFHNFCVEMADTAEAIVASVEYRLAPEHRLPAAYEDAMEALFWIRSSEDELLKQYADYSNCFLMGNSAGANIAYFAGLRAAQDQADLLHPLKIQGLILRQPFFGGTQRTESELRFENSPTNTIPLCVIDLMWEVALPIGVDRDHEYCNPTVGDEKLGKMREIELRVLVSWNGGDPLVDRQNEVVQLMEEKCVQVVKDFEEEGFHGVECFEPKKATQLIGLVKGFISLLGSNAVPKSKKASLGV